MFLVVWLSLLVLTVLTVTIAQLHIRGVSALVAVLIAAIKASIVLLFFMHLKYEKPVLKTMLFVCIGTFVIFIGLTFVDVPFR